MHTLRLEAAQVRRGPFIIATGEGTVIGRVRRFVLVDKRPFKAGIHRLLLGHSPHQTAYRLTIR